MREKKSLPHLKKMSIEFNQPKKNTNGKNNPSRKTKYFPYKRNVCASSFCKNNFLIVKRGRRRGGFCRGFTTFTLILCILTVQSKQ